MLKDCENCGKVKIVAKGNRRYCAECKDQVKRQKKRTSALNNYYKHHEKNKEKSRKRANKYYHNNKEKCQTRANKYKKEHKTELKVSRKKYYEAHKEAEKQYARNYGKNNRPKIREWERRYYKINKHKIDAKNKRYIENNKEKVAQRRRKWAKNRYHNDPQFKISNIISVLVRMGLKSDSGSKNGKSINQYLLYSFKELIQYIESLFEPWMTWKNWGIYDPKTWDDNDPATWKWQLDHIIPRSMFNFSNPEDIKKCWALSNLRPLSAKQNVIDGVRRTRHINKDNPSVEGDILKGKNGSM